MLCWFIFMLVNIQMSIIFWGEFSLFPTALVTLIFSSLSNSSSVMFSASSLLSLCLHNFSFFHWHQLSTVTGSGLGFLIHYSTQLFSQRLPTPAPPSPPPTPPPPAPFSHLITLHHHNCFYFFLKCFYRKYLVYFC